MMFPLMMFPLKPNRVPMVIMSRQAHAYELLRAPKALAFDGKK